MPRRFRAVSQSRLERRPRTDTQDSSGSTCALALTLSLSVALSCPHARIEKIAHSYHSLIRLKQIGSRHIAGQTSNLRGHSKNLRHGPATCNRGQGKADDDTPQYTLKKTWMVEQQRTSSSSRLCNESRPCPGQRPHRVERTRRRNTRKTC